MKKPTPPPTQYIKEDFNMYGKIVLIVAGLLLGYSIGYFIFILVTL